MRIRSKSWARPELEACPYFIQRPQELRGQWRQAYPRNQPLHLELGCGKGGFMAALAPAHPEINYLALDLKNEMLAMTRRKLQAAYEEAGRPVDNLFLTLCNVEQIDSILGPGDRVERIYINFCNPWPKPKHRKKRLTHCRWLAKYRQFLAPGGEIYFKTDDEALFDASLGYLDENGFALLECSRSLAAGRKDSPPTEHEEMFRRESVPIKFLIARMKGEGQ